jgi:hypothetical protein
MANNIPAEQLNEFEIQEKNQQERFRKIGEKIDLVRKETRNIFSSFDSEIWNEEDEATRAFLRETQQSINDAHSLLMKADKQLTTAYQFKRQEIRRSERAVKKKEG